MHILRAVPWQGTDSSYDQVFGLSWVRKRALQDRALNWLCSNCIYYSSLGKSESTWFTRALGSGKATALITYMLPLQISQDCCQGHDNMSWCPKGMSLKQGKVWGQRLNLQQADRHHAGTETPLKSRNLSETEWIIFYADHEQWDMGLNSPLQQPERKLSWYLGQQKQC